MKRIRRFTLLGVLTLLMSVGFAGTASAHGYVGDPASRAYLCSTGDVQDCGAIQYEPQSVEGPGHFPAEGPTDGDLCSGGNEGFAELDESRDGAWPATSVDSGQDVTFDWHMLARHATTDYRYYITEPGWDTSEPLTRADLDLEPFLEVDGHGKQPPSHVEHTATLPDRSGRHLVYAVWEIDDTANAFYQCIDVDFDGDGNDDGDGDNGDGDDGDGDDGDGDDPACEASEWDADDVYTEGDVVSYDGYEWRAEWWTTDEPSDGQWGPWTRLDACSG